MGAKEWFSLTAIDQVITGLYLCICLLCKTLTGSYAQQKYMVCMALNNEYRIVEIYGNTEAVFGH